MKIKEKLKINLLDLIITFLLVFNPIFNKIRTNFEKNILSKQTLRTSSFVF